MIPTNGLLQSKLVVKSQVSKQHGMSIETNRINGFVDGIDAVKQTIYKILNTERYVFPIYSWNYGIELMDLYGMPVSYVSAEIERRVSEALLQDDRITGVDGFSSDSSKKDVLSVTFTVHTKFGDTKEELGVNY